MSANAVFVQRGEAVDLVPSSDVEAGRIVPFGRLFGIARTSIRAGELGAIHLTGVYDVPKARGEVTAGQALYWSAETRLASPDPENGSFLGTASASSAEDAACARVLLNFGRPAGKAGAGEEEDGGDGEGAKSGFQWHTLVL